MASRARASSSIIFFVLFFAISEATQFLVGGKSNAWEINSTVSLNQWAEQNRFQIGDSLVWKYNGETDSVLQVTSKDYQTCNTSNPISIHKDGNTVVELDRSGAFFFISGAKGHCQKGEKLVVVVLSPQSIALSPAESPIGAEGPSRSPAIAPTSSTRTVLGNGYVVRMLILGSLLLALVF